MRFALRSLLTIASLLAASCTLPAPAFAQGTSSSGFAAMDARASAPAPAPDAPAPTAPAETPAIAEVDERDPREKIVDESFAKYFHGLGPHLTEFLHGRLLAWKEELKALLLELPIS